MLGPRHQAIHLPIAHLSVQVWLAHPVLGVHPDGVGMLGVEHAGGTHAL